MIRVFLFIGCLLSISLAELPALLEDYLARYGHEMLPDEALLELEGIYDRRPWLTQLTEEELSAFFFLTIGQQEWMARNHPLDIKTLRDSAIVTDREKLALLRVFVREGDPRRVKENDYFAKAAVRIHERYPHIPDTSWHGAPVNFYSQWEIRYGSYSAHLTSEKDWQETNWLDYIGFAITKEFSPQTRLLAGDFQINWQQGLVCRQSLSIDNLADNPAFIQKKTRSMSPYRGQAVNTGFRGCAFRGAFGGWLYETFAAYTHYDANFNSRGEITSFYNDGYHRDEREEEKRNRLLEKSFGGYLERRFNQSAWSAAFYTADYSPSFTTELDDRSANDFKGNQQWVLGGAGQWQLPYQVSWSGEGALSRNGAGAGLSQLVYHQSDLSLALHFHYYSASFQNFHSSAYAIGSQNRNELGIALAAQKKWPGGHRLSVVWENAKNPERTYYSIFGEKTRHRLIRYEYRQIQIDFKSTSNQRFNTTLSRDITEDQQTVRMTVDQGLNKYFNVWGRVEYHRYIETNQSAQNGFLASVRMSWRKNSWKSHWQLAWFDTDSYDTRIYLYCYELPGLWSIPAFEGAGWHTYWTGSYSYNGWLVQIKTAITIYPHGKTYSDGRDGKIFYTCGGYVTKLVPLP